MQTQILDGFQLAMERKEALLPQVKFLASRGVYPVIGAVLFMEDAGSQLYTRLKKEMAESLGIGYRVFSFSVLDAPEKILSQIEKLNKDSEITGIIIQKPWRKTWVEVAGLSEEEGRVAFQKWWEVLVSSLDEKKDVDGLHPKNLQSFSQGKWQEEGRVLPATCQATVSLLEHAFATKEVFSFLRENSLKVIILGKSDLLGQPLFALLSSQNCQVEMIGSSELKTRIENKIFFKDADVVVSATGRKNLIHGELLKEGSVVIDVGEPQGDVELASVLGKAKVVSPVPGGVGPMTVVSLMENAVQLCLVPSL